MSLGSSRLEVSLDDDFKHIIFHRFEPLIDTPFTNPMVEIHLPIWLCSSIHLRLASLEMLMTMPWSYLPPIPFAQPYVFKDGEESKGVVSTYVDKWNGWYEVNSGVDVHGDFIESENVFSKKSYLEHEVKVSSSILELVHPNSFRFTKLVPNPSPSFYSCHF